MKRFAPMTFILATLAASAFAQQKGFVAPLGGGIVPAIHVGGVVPTVDASLPTLPQLELERPLIAPEASLPQTVSVPEAVVVPGAQALSEQLTRLTKIVGDDAPNLSKASASQARGAGDEITAAMTGEHLAGGADSVSGPASSYSTPEEVKAARQVYEKIVGEVRK